MTALPFLTPQPRHITLHDEAEGASVTLPSHLIVQLSSPDLLFDAQWFRAQLDTSWQQRVSIVTSNPANLFAISLHVAADMDEQAYRLHIAGDGIALSGGRSGILHGLATLAQLFRHADNALPHLTIDDSPDYAVRGFMLDISRDKVPTMQTLYQLIDLMALLKLNQLQLYTEHTFAWQAHRAVWQDTSPMTAEEIMLLDDYCARRRIELVPNQNSLGHMERWLAHEPYHSLAEMPDGFIMHDTNRWRPASTLDPQDAGSLDLVRGLYNELLPNFRSGLFNVGCDEPWELGQGKSRDAVAERGGGVYLDWLLKLHDIVTQTGHQMMFWGDIIIRYPDLIGQLPRDAIVMEWGYEHSHPFDANLACYAAAGLSFCVCPGTSSWNSLTGRVDNAIGNLRNAADAGLKHGASGYLITDWGDNGHWQQLPVSYAGIVYGAAVAWHSAGNTDLDLAGALDRWVYRDAAGVMGGATMALGNIETMVGPDRINGQILAYAWQFSPDDYLQRIGTYQRISGDGTVDISLDNLRQVIERIDELAATIQQHRMQRDDAALVEAEWLQAATMLRHGANYLRLLQGDAAVSAEALATELELIVAEQKRLWLQRNRPGGLDDSLARFGAVRGVYSDAMA